MGDRVDDGWFKIIKLLTVYGGHRLTSPLITRSNSLLKSFLRFLGLIRNIISEPVFFYDFCRCPTDSLRSV